MTGGAAEVGGASPFFIVADVVRTTRFYAETLGFETVHLAPDDDPFFAIVRRGGAQLFFKSHGGLAAIPNPSRHPWMSWDAYVYAPDPDALAAEIAGRGVVFHKPLRDTDDGLRGFEVRDPDGYVLFFGRPKKT